MNVLVTGGAGFIGQHLARRLLKEGHTVTIFDNLLPQIHGEGARIPLEFVTSVRFIQGDVADASLWPVALDNQNAVVHLAAETGTGQSMYEVSRYDRTNLGGTAMLCHHLMNGCGKKVGRLVVASSRALYGEGSYRCGEHGIVYPGARKRTDMEAGQFEPGCPVCARICEPVPVQEASPFQPSSFYGLTKQVQEQMFLLFGRVLGISTVALRYQNVFGPGQSLSNPYTGILAVFSNLARERQTIRIFEDGLESRDFVYIDDVVSATYLAITKPIAGVHSLNVGSGVKTSVLEVAELINQHFGNDAPVAVTGQFREGDIRHACADLTLASTVLGYRSSCSFQSGLTAFLQWATGFAPTSSGYDRSLAELRTRGLMNA